MGCLGNAIWFIFGGAFMGIGWVLSGIPWGIQCFKFASLGFFPFGKEVRYGGGAVSLVFNVFWLILSGLPMALHAAFWGVLWSITIVGIPFGKQCFEIAKLALLPFGSTVTY